MRTTALVTLLGPFSDHIQASCPNSEWFNQPANGCKARILDLLIIGVLTFLGEAFTQFFQESKLLPYLAMAIEAVAAFTR